MTHLTRKGRRLTERKRNLFWVTQLMSVNPEMLDSQNPGTLHYYYTSLGMLRFYQEIGIIKIKVLPSKQGEVPWK